MIPAIQLIIPSTFTYFCASFGINFPDFLHKTTCALCVCVCVGADLFARLCASWADWMRAEMRNQTV